MKRKVKIGKATVPVIEGRTEAYFSAGAWGKGESGTYLFWAAVYLKEDGTTGAVRGRAYEHLDAGERFRRIEKEMKSSKTKEDRAAYRDCWKKLQTVICVRPATPFEVADWLVRHQSDAPYLTSLKFKT